MLNIMKTKTYILSLCTLLFFASCKKNNGCVDNTYEQDIPINDLTKVPYTDTTKLTFVRTSTNDTFTFKGHGWITDFVTTQSQEDCPQTYKLQRKQISFVSPTYVKTITLALQYYQPNGADYLAIGFNNTTFIVDPGSIRVPYSYDSLNIGNRNYYNIKYFKNQYHPEYNSPYGCFYNTAQGILRMETSDGDKWELLKVQ